ncbi:helix-turn-helix domain-containing protein [[Haemophilus] felis]|nr:helix-turn-helix domain-containing protein [[Haemophilus] felis]
MCISDRLKQILDVKGMSIKEFSELTEISYRSAMNYLNEGRDPSVNALVKIHNKLGVSITWLLTGNGDLFPQYKSDLSLTEKKLLENYNSIPINLREKISSLLDEIRINS